MNIKEFLSAGGIGALAEDEVESHPEPKTKEDVLHEIVEYSLENPTKANGQKWGQLILEHKDLFPTWDERKEAKVIIGERLFGKEGHWAGVTHLVKGNQNARFDLVGNAKDLIRYFVCRDTMRVVGYGGDFKTYYGNDLYLHNEYNPYKNVRTKETALNAAKVEVEKASEPLEVCEREIKTTFRDDDGNMTWDVTPLFATTIGGVSYHSNPYETLEEARSGFAVLWLRYLRECEKAVKDCTEALEQAVREVEEYEAYHEERVEKFLKE